MGKRQDAALETRKKIIIAVKELLKQKDPDEINIEEITKQAHIAKGSFYTHFKRKEDVISEIDFLEYVPLQEEVHHIQGVHQQISYYLIQSVKIIEKNSLAVARIWVKGAVAPIKDETSGIRKYSFDYDNILRILKQAVTQEELRVKLPLEIITQMIMNYFYGAVASWCIVGDDFKLVESIENYCQHELKNLLNSK